MFRHGKERISLSGGFLLLLAWFWLCNGLDTLIFVLAAAALHECGHLWMLYRVGGHLHSLRINALGAVMETDSHRLGYWQELLVLLAGPGMNLLTALLIAFLGGHRGAAFVGVNFVLCAFNLLPIVPLDGGQSLYLAVSWAAGPMVGEWAVRCIGTACALSVISLILWLMYCSGGSLWFVPVVGGLLTAIMHLWSKKLSYYLK